MTRPIDHLDVPLPTLTERLRLLLADLEMDALVRVEQEMERRAHGVRPWSIADYLNQNAKEHARFEVARRVRLGRVAA